MEITMGEWHTYPTGCGYQLMRPIHGGEGCFGEEECRSRSRERELQLHERRINI
jgi:hypothetical protein